MVFFKLGGCSGGNDMEKRTLYRIYLWYGPEEDTKKAVRKGDGYGDKEKVQSGTDVP